MTIIRDVIKKIINKLSYCDEYKKAWIEKYWEEFVGTVAGKHSRPYKVENEVLYVNVDSSVWNQELFIKKTNIIIKINQKFARKVVKDIKYKIGYFPVVEEEKEKATEDMRNLLDEPTTGRKIVWDDKIVNSLKNRKH